ncbi:hypothetical protein PLESTB_001604200 [Pleodorina starrii]|uniref:Rubisco LSMT substrate-binding domain-containing protein n=1 Tax=Pleodorina starrii TaxID=330485 RepID=A0A9W6BYC0_9CHLO|nr:hypothetical protein PLESTB_001604200 [Pleodorina starrii]
MGAQQRQKSADGPSVAADRHAGDAGPTSAFATRSSLPDFEAWMTKAGITFDKSLIQLRAGGGDGSGNGPPRTKSYSAGTPLQPSDAPWAVYAVTDVPEGRVLATIPRHAVLSAPNSGLSDILAAEKLGGGLALVAAVMYEAARGLQSKWYGYLSSLPPREYLPVYWSEEQLQQLEGTDIADRARTDREAMAADFESELAPLLSRYPARLGPLAGGWSLEAFMRAASWVASRAFYVDEHHGDALVPLADVFNHKAARVDLGGRAGAWAEGLEVAEHADARLRQQRSGGGGGGSDSRKRRRGQRQGQDAGSDDDSDDDDDGEEEGAEGGDGEDEDEDEDEEGGEDDGSSSADGDSGDGEGEEPGEGEEEGEGSEGGPSSSEASEGGGDPRDTAKAKAGRRRVGAAELDREPGDDGSDPWPPQPPPPPPQPEEARAGGGGKGRGSDAGAGGGTDGGGGGGGSVLGGRWGLLAEEAVARGGQNLHLDIGICAGERGGCELLDIVAAQPLAAGAEVFNTYGEHGNDELVNKYGFALPCNPFDEVTLDKGAVVAAAQAELGRVAALARVRVLAKQSDLLAEDEEPFLLLPPRHVNTSLYVALRLLAGGGSLEDALAPLRAAWQRERQERRRRPQPSAPPNAQPDPAGKGSEEPSAEKEEEEEEDEEDGDARKGKRRRGSGRAVTAVSGAADGGDGGTTEVADEDCRPRKRGKGGAAAAAAAPADGKARARQDLDPKASGSGSGSSGGAEDSDGEGDGSDDDDLPQDVEIQPGSKTGSGFDKSEQKAGAKAGKGKPRRGGAAGGRGEGPGGGGGGAGGDRDSAAAQPLWTDSMRALLRRVISERLAAYPTTLEQDEQELRNPSAAVGREEEGKEDKEKKTKKGKKGGADGGMGGGGGGTTAEAAAARSCALLLRIGEKQLLTQALAHLI